MDLSKEEKRGRTFTILSEWPSAREQLKLDKMYNPELGLDLEQKFIANQQFHALKVYEKIGTESGHCLEKFLEWDGTLDEFSMETSTHFPNFESNNLDVIEKELRRTAHTHFLSKKQRYLITLLEQTIISDISGIQDVQSYSPEHNVTFQKFTAMTMIFWIYIHCQKI